MRASIVVPIYNAETTLHRCLSSIAAQTHRDLEVILVDDGSTDGSGAICGQWAEGDPRFRVLRQENRGPGAARNAGLDAAAGDVIFFFDSDDEAEVGLVEQTLLRFRETGAQVVLYGCSHVMGKTAVPRPLTAPKPVFTGGEIQKELLPDLFTYGFGAGVSPWGKGYDLNVLRQYGLRFPGEQGLVCEDGLFMLALFSKVSCAAVLPDCLYRYYRNSNSLSRRFQPDRQVRNNGFLKTCTELIRANGLPEKTLFHIRARYHGLTLGTMGALLDSDLPRREKNRQLSRLLRDPVLAETLQQEVLALDAPMPRLFWRCLKQKWYGLCRLLLWANGLKKRREVQR